MTRFGGTWAAAAAIGIGLGGLAGEPAPALAQPADAASATNLDASLDTVTLVTGETLAGRVVARDEATVTLRHPVLGEVVLPLAGVSAVTLAPVDPAAGGGSGASAPAGEPEPIPVDQISASAELTLDQPAADPVEPAEPPVLWSGRFELGANGASGNSDTNAFYAAFNVKREAARSTFTDELSYRLSTDDGTTTANRFFNRARYERRLAEESRWSWFLQTTLEADEFKDFDTRVTGSAGVGHEAIKTERTTLSLYAGAGAAREFGGSDDTINPFALVGAGYSHRLNHRVAFNASAELEPRLDDLGEYLLRTKAAFDVDLNDSGSLKLSFSVEDQFDSDPGDARKNDVYYTAAIVYSF